MLQSMTGFGQSALTSELGEITIEIKSLNSKNFDINFNIHSHLKDLEKELRSLLSAKLLRGKIEFKISIATEKPANSFNKKIIKNYIKELKSVVKTKDSELLKIAINLPEVFSKQNFEITNSQKDEINNQINKACKELIEFRKQEGKALEKDLNNQINLIQKDMLEVIDLAPERKDSIKNKLNSSLQELNVELNKERWDQEIIYYLEKYDINEEIVRLKNHLNFFRETVNSSISEKGKKLVFISQEIGREINTIGSKANHSAIQKNVVEMKNNLEKIKEQLLNVL